MLSRLGYAFLIPSGFNHRYDAVLDVGEMIKVQIKTARPLRGSIVFNTVSVRSNTRSVLKRGYAEEADIFIAYCPQIDRAFALPVIDAPSRAASLRLDPTENNQATGIRWAADHELPHGLDAAIDRVLELRGVKGTRPADSHR